MGTKNMPGCKLVRPTATYEGTQRSGILSAAISAESVGAKGLCLHLLTIPPGAKADVHLHEGHETAGYLVSGEAGLWYGENLEEHLLFRAGDFVYIPAGVPHQPYNASETEPAVAVLARTDPNEQESVVPLPHLEGLH